MDWSYMESSLPDVLILTNKDNGKNVRVFVSQIKYYDDGIDYTVICLGDNVLLHVKEKPAKIDELLGFEKISENK